MPQTKSTYQFEYMAGRLIGGDHCMFLEDQGQLDDLVEVPLRLHGDTTVPPGTLFKKMDGPNTSHTFKTVHMIDPSRLKYQGILNTFDGPIAVFQKYPEPSKKYIPCYFHNEDGDYCEFVYVNRHRSISIVQLSNCIYTKP